MTDNEKIKELLEASSDGVITAEQVTAAGLHRSVLQRKYGRDIYSHETSLYLPGYFDRTPAH